MARPCSDIILIFYQTILHMSRPHASLITVHIGNCWNIQNIIKNIEKQKTKSTLTYKYILFNFFHTDLAVDVITIPVEMSS